MGRVKEMYMEMLERDLEYLTEEQFFKELKEKGDSEE